MSDARVHGVMRQKGCEPVLYSAQFTTIEFRPNRLQGRPFQHADETFTKIQAEAK
jgi:hypothetical protein